MQTTRRPERGRARPWLRRSSRSASGTEAVGVRAEDSDPVGVDGIRRLAGAPTPIAKALLKAPKRLETGVTQPCCSWPPGASQCRMDAGVARRSLSSVAAAGLRWDPEVPSSNLGAPIGERPGIARLLSSRRPTRPARDSSAGAERLRERLERPNGSPAGRHAQVHVLTRPGDLSGRRSARRGVGSRGERVVGRKARERRAGV